MPKPLANGSTSVSVWALSARCPDMGARSSRPQRRRIAQWANPIASPKPPPTRLEKAPPRDPPHPRAQPPPAVPAVPPTRPGLRRTARRRYRARRRCPPRARGIATIGVAGPPAIGLLQCLARRERDRSALADHPLATHDRGARGFCSGARSVGRPVIGDPQRGARKRFGERGKRCRDAVGLVVGGNYYEVIRGHDRLATAGIVPAVIDIGILGGSAWLR